MANIRVREHPASNLLDLKQNFERIFHHIFKHAAGSAETFLPVVPPIETWIDTEDKEFHLSIPVPGMKPEALNIILQGKQLTFSGEQKQQEDKKKKNYLEREFSFDRFVRTVTLPDGVDGEKLTAQLKDGILEITAPIAAAALPKKITVSTGAGPTKEGVR